MTYNRSKAKKSNNNEEPTILMVNNVNDIDENLDIFQVSFKRDIRSYIKKRNLN